MVGVDDDDGAQSAPAYEERFRPPPRRLGESVPAWQHGKCQLGVIPRREPDANRNPPDAARYWNLPRGGKKSCLAVMAFACDYGI